MSAEVVVDESYGVRIRPFPALLVLGTACSLGVLGMQASAAVTTGGPTSTEAAPEAAPATPTPKAAAPVATASPTEPPDSAVSAVQDEQPHAPPATTPEATPTAAPPPSDTAPGVGASALVAAPTLVEGPEKAAALLELMNAARADAGLPALIRDDALAGVAQARAADLGMRGYFDHYSPTGESAFSELGARGIRYRLAGENLARNNYPDGRTVSAAFDGLMASPGHRANILEARFTHAGVVAVRNGRLWIYVTVFTD